jgi:hypothetical protein
MESRASFFCGILALRVSSSVKKSHSEPRCFSFISLPISESKSRSEKHGHIFHDVIPTDPNNDSPAGISSATNGMITGCAMPFGQ